MNVEFLMLNYRNCSAGIGDYKMQLVDYEEYIVNNNFVDVSKSSYYSACVKKFLNLNLSDQLNMPEKVRQFVQYPITNTEHPISKEGHKRTFNQSSLYELHRTGHSISNIQ